MKEFFYQFLEKLVCKHDWEEVKHIKTYEEESDTIPISHTFLLKCKKCGKIKKVKI